MRIKYEWMKDGDSYIRCLPLENKWNGKSPEEPIILENGHKKNIDRT